MLERVEKYLPTLSNRFSLENFLDIPVQSAFRKNFFKEGLALLSTLNITFSTEPQSTYFGKIGIILECDGNLFILFIMCFN